MFVIVGHGGCCRVVAGASATVSDWTHGFKSTTLVVKFRVAYHRRVSILPKRSNGRRRDRHGRGMRGPLVGPRSPAFRSRAQKFDDVLAVELAAFHEHLGPRLDRFDVAVLDVPAADPAPWEDGVPLARFLPFERPSKIYGRLVFYRMPLEMAMLAEDDPRGFIHEVMVGQIATAMEMDPRDVDYLR